MCETNEQIVELHKMDEVLEIINFQTYDKYSKRYRDTVLYRGLQNSDYHLETSLERNCKGLKSRFEEKLISNFSKYTALESGIEKESIWRKMVLGQHHGLPTRLLDWTHSPLVALHFAVSSSDLNDLENEDCAIWKIEYGDIHREEVLPELFFKALKEKRTQLFTVDMLDEITPSLQEFDEIIEDKTMVVLEPPSIDPRIVNQYAFLSVVPNKITNVDDFLFKISGKTKKYIIDKKIKWQIRDYLDEINISERTIYPGLDGICKWLARHYFVRSK